MSSNPILRNYVSDLDQFLQEFAEHHPALSQTQQQEVTKYRRIHGLRDDVENKPAPTSNKLWEGF